MSHEPCPTVLALQKDTRALKQLAELKAIVKLPPSKGGFYFLDGEREFIRGARRKHDEHLSFTLMQREMIDRLWRAVEAWKRDA